MVLGPEKRLPGQSNADYGVRRDPNAEFMVTQPLQRGWDLSWVMWAAGAVVRWVGRRNRPS